MAGLQDMMKGSYEAMTALMSPEFNKVLDNRIAQKNNSAQADPNMANMSLSEALQQSPYQQVQPMPQMQSFATQAQRIQQPSLKAGVITESRDFSYLDGSNKNYDEPDQNLTEPTITPEMIKESSLPDFMKQSFLEEPPVQGVLPKDNIDVFAEQLIAKGIIPKKTEQKKVQPTMVKEAVANEKRMSKDGDMVPTKYYDYQSEDIHTMVKSIVKEQMNILYKQLRKDMVKVANQIVDNVGGSPLTTIKVGSDSFKFMDGDGNVFEADLRFVGNKKANKK